MNNQKDFIDLVNKVNANNSSIDKWIQYEFIPLDDRQNIRIENGREIWRGLVVLRVPDVFKP